MYVSSVWLYHLVTCWVIVLNTLLCQGEPQACPKLQFQSDHGCQPCSLCNPVIAQEENLIRDECRNGNPDALADERVLWCDDPKGPFPECPPLHHSLLQTPCSESCNANFRTFAPGCTCTVDCPGKPSYVVLCTDKFQWNHTDIPSQCLVPSASTVAPEDNETLAPKRHRAADEESVVLPIVIGSLVSFILIGITVAIIGTCMYQRLRLKFCPPQPSGASTSPLLRERAGGGSHSSSSEERIPMSSEEQESGQTGQKHSGGSTDGVLIVPVDSEKMKELASVAVQIPRTERDGVQQRETGRDQTEVESIQALKALMDSYQDLLELSKRFDQEYAFDRITWHDVAIDLLGWDHNDLHHTQYNVCRSPSSSPGDGPMYQVLEAARQQGKGLLDLIDCLRRQRKSQGAYGSKETEKVLVEFWQNWKSKQASEELC